MLVNEGAVFHQNIGGHLEKGVDYLVRALQVQLVRQLGERAEVCEQDRELGNTPLFDVRVASVTKIWIARAASDSSDSEEIAQWAL